MYDIDKDSLDASSGVLNYWQNENLKIQFHNSDVNSVVYEKDSSTDLLLINTACEHIVETSWLERLPKGTKVLLQSTDMKHHEHINCPQDLEDFKKKYSDHIQINFTDSLFFKYPNFSFTRFMLTGIKN